MMKRAERTGLAATLALTACLAAVAPASADEPGPNTVPINVVAIAYQVVMVVNLAWPRSAIYDLTGDTWWLKWSALLFIALTLVVGAGIHWRTRLRHGGSIRLPELRTSGSTPLSTAYDQN